MAKKKKTKTSKKSRKGESHSKETGSERYMQECLDEMDLYDDLSIKLVPKYDKTSSRLLNSLLPLFDDPKEREILETSGAFGRVALDPKCSIAFGKPVENLPKSKIIIGSPAPPVKVYGSERIGDHKSLALGEELKHIGTQLHPVEMKFFMSELLSDLIDHQKVTHHEISDKVMAAIAPSTAQKLALQADAQYKYTSSQYCQVYNKMRHVVLNHKLLQRSAHADALLLSAYGLQVDPLTEEEKQTPISAIDAFNDSEQWDALPVVAMLSLFRMNTLLNKGKLVTSPEETRREVYKIISCGENSPAVQRAVDAVVRKLEAFRPKPEEAIN